MEKEGFVEVREAGGGGRKEEEEERWRFGGE